jgi:exopolysaccharide production protein ExoQ
MRQKLQNAIVVFILLVEMRAFHNLLTPAAESSDAANVYTQDSPAVGITVLFAGCLLVLLVLPHIRKLAQILFHNPLILAIVLMVTFSVVWSIDLGFSLHRVGLFLASTTLALFIGQRYGVDQIQKIVRDSILVMLAASALILVVLPRIVLDPANPGAVRGLSGHKNAFGFYIGLLAVMFLTGGMRSWRPRALRYLAFVFTMGLLFLSHSSTAWFSFALVAGTLPLLRLLQRRPSLLFPKVILGAVLLAPLIVALTGGLDLTFGSLVGKDETLTGRTKLWVLLMDAVEKKPINGYGYDAYLGSQGSEWDHIVKKIQWAPAHAHSGYIQTALSIGLLGLGLFIVLLLKCVWKAVIYLRENQDQIGLFPLAMLLYLIAHNITETTFLESSGLANICFFAIYVSMSAHPRLANVESLFETEQNNSSMMGSLSTQSVAGSTSS